MKKTLLPLLVALSLGSGSAMAVNAYTIAPGDTLAPADQESAVYTGVVSKSGGSFTDSYNINFTNYTNPDRWSFRIHGISLDLDSLHLTGLSGLSMSLYDGVGTLLWSAPAAGTTTTYSTPAGVLAMTDLNAYATGIYAPGNYRFDVAGSGTGFYDVTLTVPEPETWAIFLAGIALLGLRLRNRQNMLG